MEVEFKQLKEVNLRTLDDLHALFPHWRKSSVQKKIRATSARKDKRFVALKEGRIVGHLRIVFGKGLHRHRFEITSMVVHPKFRRRGIGKGLLKFALGDVKGKRKLVLLAVASKNRPAISLYQKAGFKKYGLLKKAAFTDGKYVDNLLMCMEI